VVLWTIVAWLGLFGVYRLYDPDLLFSGTQEYERAFNACLLGTLLLALYSFTSRGIEVGVSRGWLFIAAPLATVSVLGARFAYRRVVHHLRREGLLQRRTCIVGLNDEGRDILRQISMCPSEGYHVVGLVDERTPLGTQVESAQVIGRLRHLERLIGTQAITDLIVIPTALSRSHLLELYQAFAHDPRVHIHLSTGLYELYTTAAQVKSVAYVPLVSLNRMRITGLNAASKAVLDYGLALVLLIVLSPALLALAIWIRRDSPGPAVYRRRVLGVGGKTFDAYKLRTMVVDGDRVLAGHPELARELAETGKLQDDPRVTRAGRLLRRLSLDEIPQLANILRGEMSLVGPRMITPGEWDKFGRHRHNLLTVKPGLTGLWQISGRSDIGYEERARLDMNYIRNYSLWLDLHILLNTATAVLKGKGAY
jgi:exopolysaccharide biosynthesis polyprenyl glycosylphosphotransferase